MIFEILEIFLLFKRSGFPPPPKIYFLESQESQREPWERPPMHWAHSPDAELPGWAAPEAAGSQPLGPSSAALRHEGGELEVE